MKILFINEFTADSTVCNSIRRISNAYAAHLSEDNSECIKEQVYSASANEIDDVKPILKDLPSNLEYAYLNGNVNSPVIIASNLTKKEKESLLQVLYKRRGVMTSNKYIKLTSFILFN